MAASSPSACGSSRRLSTSCRWRSTATWRNKEELLDGLVDVVIGEIDPPRTDTDWKTAMRERILSARRALLRHPWASRVMESRTAPTPVALAYMDSMIGLLRSGGFSLELTHHVLHAMGSRTFGFAQELFNDTGDSDPQAEAQMWEAMAGTYPYIYEIFSTISHDDDIGRRCWAATTSSSSSSRSTSCSTASSGSRTAA